MADDDGLRTITKLVWPFPSDVIKKNPSGGGDYVPHPIVEQRLIYVLGRPPTTEVVEIIRGTVLGGADDATARGNRKNGPTLDDCVVGVVLRMRCTIDGEVVEVVEAGDCEDPHNWPNDGARLKDAMSDAYKRCAMRLGVGLHLWTKEPQRNYTIARRFYELDKPEEPSQIEVPDTEPIDTTAREADDSEPEAPSEPSPPPEVPPAQEDAPQAPQPGDDIDWPKVAKEMGITQATAITEARDLAASLGIDKPGSLRHIPQDLAAPLYERFTQLASASSDAS